MKRTLRSFGRDRLEPQEFAEVVDAWCLALEGRGVKPELIEPTASWFLKYGAELPVPSEFADRAIELKPRYFVQVSLEVIEGGEEKLAFLEFPRAQWDRWSDSQRQMAIANHAQMRDLVSKKPESVKSLSPPTERSKKMLAKLMEEPSKPEKPRRPKTEFVQPSEEEIAKAERKRAEQIRSLKEVEVS